MFLALFSFALSSFAICICATQSAHGRRSVHCTHTRVRPNRVDSECHAWRDSVSICAAPNEMRRTADAESESEKEAEAAIKTNKMNFNLLRSSE